MQIGLLFLLCISKVLASAPVEGIPNLVYGNPISSSATCRTREFGTDRLPGSVQVDVSDNITKGHIGILYREKIRCAPLSCIDKIDNKKCKTSCPVVCYNPNDECVSEELYIVIVRKVMLEFYPNHQINNDKLTYLCRCIFTAFKKYSHGHKWSELFIFTCIAMHNHGMFFDLVGSTTLVCANNCYGLLQIKSAQYFDYISKQFPESGVRARPAILDQFVSKTICYEYWLFITHFYYTGQSNNIFLVLARTLIRLKSDEALLLIGKTEQCQLQLLLHDLKLRRRAEALYLMIRFLKKCNLPQTVC